MGGVSLDTLKQPTAMSDQGTLSGSAFGGPVFDLFFCSKTTKRKRGVLGPFLGSVAKSPPRKKGAYSCFPMRNPVGCCG